MGVRIPIDPRSELDYIDIIKGQLGSEEVVMIIDQNNNQSFTDDSLFSPPPIDWYSSKNSIPITFLVSNGVDTTQQQSWIRIGSWNGEIIYGSDEHLAALITIDDKIFEFGVIDQPLSGYFTYGLNPEIALLSSQSDQNDPVNIRDLIKMDEDLKLNRVYYKFDSINNDGSILRLIKEETFDKKTGTQVGMYASEFEFRSAAGDTVNTLNLHDKPLIIANTCACGGDTKSSQAYFEIKEAYQANAYVLRLDSFSENLSDKWTINMDDEFNKNADIAYRRKYCSRVCFVIGKNQRILDKFLITDWKTNLPEALRH
ncbi:MAG: hypothetical protein AAF616_04800 [Bacteroidota bacterium]